MDALSTVIANPGSISARQQLATAWSEMGDPRAELLEKSLRLRDGRCLSARQRSELRADVRNLIEKHGRAWAGRIAALADSFSYQLGLIDGISIRGDVFVKHAPELFALAPIQHVGLVLPIDFEALCRRPELAKLATLHIDGRDNLGDREATMLAECPYFESLRGGSWGDNIGAAGLQAIVSSPHLRSLIYLEITGNPCTKIPSVTGGYLSLMRLDDRWFLQGPASRPYWDDAVRASYQTYSQTIEWPPTSDQFSWTE